MLITREFVINSNGFTQTELKFSLILLQHYQNNNGEFNENYIVKAHLLHTFKTANSSKLASKTINKIQLKDEFSSIFSYLYYEYPGIIKFRFKQEIEDATDTIEFDETLLTTLPNTGSTLKLLLLLLFAIKDNQFDFTIDKLATTLFSNKNAYNPQAVNSAANQLSKLKEAIDELNTITDFFISIEPIKSSRSITGFHFNVLQPNPTAKHTDADTIKELLKLNKFPLKPKNINDYLSLEFVSLFATNEDASELIKYITKNAAVLLQTGILNNTKDTYTHLARQTLLYHHTKPKLWYTMPKALIILQQYMFTHPTTFINDIINIINENTGFSELVKSLTK